MIPVGVNLHETDDFRVAVYPLFEAGEVDILEYSFDTGWSEKGPPEWVSALVDFYSSKNLLLGHGVSFSPLSAKWEERQQRWIEHFAVECKRRTYQHMSEHFGFATSGNFHDSAPLPAPLTPSSLRIGQERLKKLSEVCNLPTGIENLAFAFGPDDVKQQGEFLDKLVEPIDGFLLLDLHNFYCQSFNFDVPADTLLRSYPLQRVRELHVSGGSWSFPQGRAYRRDTHDGAVPQEVCDLLSTALAACPNVKAVVYERFGGTIGSQDDAGEYAADYRKIRKLVSSFSPP